MSRCKVPTKCGVCSGTRVPWMLHVLSWDILSLLLITLSHSCQFLAHNLQVARSLRKETAIIGGVLWVPLLRRPRWIQSSFYHPSATILHSVNIEILFNSSKSLRCLSIKLARATSVKPSFSSIMESSFRGEYASIPAGSAQIGGTPSASFHHTVGISWPIISDIWILPKFGPCESSVLSNTTDI